MGFIPNKDDGHHPVDGSILSITRLDAWIITNIELLTVEVKRGGGRQNDFNILYSANLKLDTEQLISCIIQYVD